MDFKPAARNQLFFNSKLSHLQRDVLIELKSEFENQYGLTDYFLIASSGSSQALNESVKLVALHRDAILNSANRVNHYLQASSSDDWGLFLPSFHIAGLALRARAYLSSSNVKEFEWGSPVLKQEFWNSTSLQFTSFVPTQIYDLVQHQIQAPQSIKKVFVGAGSLSSGLKESAFQLGWPVVESYGMTETASMIALREYSHKNFSVMSGVHVRVQQDLLQIKCDSLLTAIMQKIDKKIKIVHQNKNDWFQTEDRVRLTEQSPIEIELLGRHYDYIKIMGEGVSVTELQSRLEQLMSASLLKPNLACIVAVQNERKNFELCLVVEASLGSMHSEKLQHDFNLQVLPFERLTKVVTITHLPRTELGKLKIEELKYIIKQLK